MNYDLFIKKALEDERFFDEAAKFYIVKQSKRSFFTYKYCLSRLKPGAKVLSVGGFHCTIEKMLREDLNVEVTVIDYPDSIAIQKDYYDFLGFKYVGIDLSKGFSGLDKAYFDMIIYTEVIEHIPTAPYEQLLPFDAYLKPGGSVIVTTPNMTSIVHIAKLFMKLPLFDTPEKFFSPVAPENLQVHRREYMPSEIQEAFQRMGYSSIVKYFIYNKPKSLQYRMMYFIGNMISRFKEGMLIEGTKPR